MTLLVLVACSDDGDPRAVLIEGIQPTGEADVRLHYVGGPCSGDVDHVKIDEGQDHITFTLWVDTVQGDCEAIGVPATHEVHLPHPIGGRTLLDGVCAEEFVPEQCPDGAAPVERPSMG